MNEYRIIEGVYKNEYGEKERISYYVKEKKKFLGIKYWSFVKHLQCGYGDCYYTKTEFNSHHDAYQFVKNNLCGKDFKEGWSYKVINEFSCNQNK